MEVATQDAISYHAKYFYLIMSILTLWTGRLMFASSSKTWLSRAITQGSRNRGIHPIQQIYQSLEEIENIEKSAMNPTNCSHIASCLQEMNFLTLNDLGIKQTDLEGLSDSICMNIIRSEKYHISVFCLPKGCKLPVHDHPSMTVCSKLIVGELSIKSFTPKSVGNDGNDLYATVDKNETFFPSNESWLLTPTMGNVHEFEAQSTCVIFDILLPPYLEPHRPCTFYNVHQQDQRTWLLSKMSPHELKNVDLPYSVPYSGLKPLC